LNSKSQSIEFEDPEDIPPRGEPKKQPQQEVELTENPKKGDVKITQDPKFQKPLAKEKEREYQI